MNTFDPTILKNLYKPASDSHKGQNGKLMIIGGSHLFHAASLWSLEVASRIVDMVFYSSVPENNALVEKAKEEFRNGIVVPRGRIDDYISEADCVLIGPGLPREEGKEAGDDDTQELTDRLLKKYSDKKWVVDGGSLQVIKPEEIPANAILTPHRGEFLKLFESRIKPSSTSLASGGNQELWEENVQRMAKEFHCIILLKGETDIVASPSEAVKIAGGNAGMTKGGTGDVLAGLVAALACNNEPFLAACAGSYINKKAGEALAKKVGLYFNASDLAKEIPHILAEVIK